MDQHQANDSDESTDQAPTKKQKSTKQKSTKQKSTKAKTSKPKSKKAVSGSKKVEGSDPAASAETKIESPTNRWGFTSDASKDDTIIKSPEDYFWITLEIDLEVDISRLDYGFLKSERFAELQRSRDIEVFRWYSAKEKGVLESVRRPRDYELIRYLFSMDRFIDQEQLRCLYGAESTNIIQRLRRGGYLQARMGRSGSEFQLSYNVKNMVSKRFIFRKKQPLSAEKFFEHVVKKQTMIEKDLSLELSAYDENVKNEFLRLRRRT